MIRRATVEDIRPIYDMMKSYFSEHTDRHGYPLAWDDERVVIHLGNLLYHEDGLNFISENNEGVILGEIGDTWFGPNRMAKPHVLYVRPEHRNGLIARALLRTFEHAAQQRGAGFVLWEFETGLSDTKMVGGLMEKLDYEYQGPIYKKLFFEGSQSCHK